LFVRRYASRAVSYLSVVSSDDPVWLSMTAAARRLGVTPRMLYRLIDERQVPAYKMGRVLRLQRREIDAYLERCRVRRGELRHLYPPVRGDASG
jgi:excisionase family DNA binding protein